MSSDARPGHPLLAEDTDPAPSAPGLFADLRPQLPLFPLDTVLFPGGLLPLRVFEVRYLDLISARLRSGEPFGVVALIQGGEVRRDGETVRFEPEGCLAEVVDCDSEQTGILQVRCRGARRFMLAGQAHQGSDGLWRADAVLQDEDAPAPLPPELQPCATALGRAIATLAQRGQHPFFMPHRLDDAGWLANRWSEILPIPLATRHKLMTLPDPLARLRLVDGFLRRHGIVGG